MKVGVIGSRTFTDGRLMGKVLSDLHARRGITLVVSGGARGADTLAVKWAEREGIKVREHLPDGGRYGLPRAYFERNSLIVDDVDVLYVFYGPDGPTPGSTDTRDKAIARRLPVVIYSQAAP